MKKLILTRNFYDWPFVHIIGSYISMIFAQKGPHAVKVRGKKNIFMKKWQKFHQKFNPFNLNFMTKTRCANIFIYWFCTHFQCSSGGHPFTVKKLQLAKKLFFLSEKPVLSSIFDFFYNFCDPFFLSFHYRTLRRMFCRKVWSTWPPWRPCFCPLYLAIWLIPIVPQNVSHWVRLLLIEDYDY